RHVFVGADAVNHTGPQKILGVARVTGDEDRHLAFDDDGYVTWRVAWCRHDKDIAAAGQRHPFRKRAERSRLEPNRLEVDPLRPPVRQISLDSTRKPACPIEFSRIHPDALTHEMRQPT